MKKKQMSKKVLQGKVIKISGDKTISVLVERSYRHKLYKKIIRSHKKYLAHDENNSAKLGQQVKIEESRPISKRKTWILINAV